MTENFDRLALTTTTRLIEIGENLSFALRFISRIDNQDIADNLLMNLHKVSYRIDELIKRIEPRRTDDAELNTNRVKYTLRH